MKGSIKTKTKKLEIIKILYLLLFLSVVISCSKSDENSDIPVKTPDWYYSVDSLIKQSMAESGAPATIVGVFHYDEAPVVITVGHSNIDQLSKVTHEMKFRIASNTKTFVGQTVLLLVEDGLIDLDSNLTDYLPDCGIQNADNITIRQMLNMTSGIANYNAQAQFVDIWNTDPLIQWPTDTILSIIKRAEPDFPPGEGWNYSDSNYFLLGLIIELVTNEEVEDVIDDRIIIPLMLENTSFPITPEIPEPYCSGYKIVESGLLNECSRISPTGPWTGGAMISNIYDIGTWVKTLGTGSLLSDKLKTQCFDFVTVSDKMGYGLGLIEVIGLRGHTGMIQGYETSMFYSVEKNASVVVMFNKCNEDQHSQPAVSLSINIFKILYPELF